MKSFCYAIEQLSGTNVHSLSNNITIQSDVHEWFTRLEIWFEKTSTPPYPAHSHPQASDNENLPVPSETLHATCAKVAQLSGAAENTDKQDRVVEDLGVDESSPEVLSGALLKSKNQPIRLVLKI